MRRASEARDRDVPLSAVRERNAPVATYRDQMVEIALGPNRIFESSRPHRVRHGWVGRSAAAQLQSVLEYDYH